MNNSIEFNKLIKNINSITISREQQKELIKLLGERIGFYFPPFVWKNITDFMLEKDNRKYAEKYFNDIIQLNKNFWNKKLDEYQLNFNKHNFDGITDEVLEQISFYSGRTNNIAYSHRNDESWVWSYKKEGDNRYKKEETWKPNLNTKMSVYLTDFKFIGKSGNFRDFEYNKARSFNCNINVFYHENGICKEKRTINKSFNKRNWNGFKKDEELIFIDRSANCWDWKIKCMKNLKISTDSISGLVKEYREFNEDGIIKFQEIKFRNNIEELSLDSFIKSLDTNHNNNSKFYCRWDTRDYRFGKLLDEKRRLNNKMPIN
tara:strand:- start:442 stop:1395 length:954 start_codon:yes stop_codon:yes gene_type:complete